VLPLLVAGASCLFFVVLLVPIFVFVFVLPASTINEKAEHLLFPSKKNSLEAVRMFSNMVNQVGFTNQDSHDSRKKCTKSIFKSA